MKSATRVLDLFELLAQHRAGLAHNAIAEALGIPKSSLSQLIRSLVRRDYVTYDPHDRSYRLGARLSQLARQAFERDTLIALAEPVLAEITRATGESSALNVLEGFDSKVIAAVSSPHRLVSHMRLGDIAPLYATSAGKALLATFAEDRLARFFAEVPLTPITPRTITAETVLRKQLDAIRRGAVAEVIEEFTPGVAGMAVAIASRGGVALGAINLAIPAVRFDAAMRRRATTALTAGAASLTRRLSEADPTD